LQVDHVMEGGLRCEGSRIRVTAHLIRTGDQVQVWSGAYEQNVPSILRLQRELAITIVQEVRVTLTEGPVSPASRHEAEHESGATLPERR
jgi:adenylate cyclase